MLCSFTLSHWLNLATLTKAEASAKEVRIHHSNMTIAFVADGIENGESL
jgi:hypothetical protein